MAERVRIQAKGGKSAFAKQGDACRRDHRNAGARDHDGESRGTA